MSAVLHLGDCLAPAGLPSLSDRSVGVTITDPPFDARTHEGAGRGRVPFAAIPAFVIAATAAELARVTSRWIVLFSPERLIETWAQGLESSGARVVRIGVAIRTNPMPQLSGDRPAPAVDHVVVAHASAGRMRWNGGGRPARWESPPARFDNTDHQLAHPAQKSIKLLRALVEDFTDPGELICDPFAGHATTLVAAAQLGRRALGWERDPGYHAAARARLGAIDLESVGVDGDRPDPGRGLLPQADLFEVDPR